MPEFSICCRTVGVLVGLAMLAGCAANAPVSKQAEPEPVRSPKQARELSRQGMLAHQQGQTSVAIEALQKAVALDPTDARSEERRVGKAEIRPVGAARPQADPRRHRLRPARSECS